MSVDLYLCCAGCQKRIHVAQDGLSGFRFYSGERDCMDKLGAWLGEHVLLEGNHAFVVAGEQSFEDYPEIEWRPNHWTPKEQSSGAGRPASG